MTDIASLVIKVDSTSAETAKTKLDALATSAKSVKDAAAGLTQFAKSLQSAAVDIEKAAAKNKESLSTYQVEKYNRILAAAAGETDKLRKSDINSYVTYMKKMEAAYKENEKIQQEAIAAQKRAQEQLAASAVESTKVATGYDLINRSMKSTISISGEAKSSLSAMLGVVQQQEVAAVKAAQGYDLLNRSMQSVAASSAHGGGIGAMLGMGGAKIAASESVEKVASSVAGLSMAYGKAATASGELGSVSVVTGRSIAQTAEAIKEVEAAAGSSDTSVKMLAKSMYQFLLVGAGISTVIGMWQKLKESIQVSADFEKMNKTLAITSTTAGEAGRDMEFVRKAAQDLGLSVISTGEAFAKLKASALGTQMQGEGVKQIFLSVSKAMAAIGASEGETTGALRAIGQMMNKGKIMAEELRGQLGEHLPGALNIMARALGVSTQELDKMVTKGLDANTVLPKFAAELDKISDKAKFDSIENNLNRITTAIANLVDQTMKALGVPEVIKSIADAVTPVDNSIEGLKKRINDLTAKGPSTLGRSVLYEDFKREYAELNRQLDEAIAKQERLEKQAKRQGRFTGGSVGAVAGAPAFVDAREQEQINKAREKGEQQLKTLESERLQIQIEMLRAKGDELGAIRAEVDARYKNKAQADEAYNLEVELFKLREKNREANKKSRTADTSAERERERQQKTFENMANELSIQTKKYEGMTAADIHYYETLETLRKANLTKEQEASIIALADQKHRQELAVEDLNARIAEEEKAQKAIADAQKQSQKDVREEALRTLEVMSSNLDYAREMATGLSDAFGEVGKSIGGMGVALAEYAKQQETIMIQKEEDILKNPEKRYEIEEAAAMKSARTQIKAYGDMTAAAQGFFKKGTAGYRAMETASKIFRAFELAAAAQSAVQQIADMTKVVTTTVAGTQAMATADAAATTASIAGAEAEAVANAGVAVTNQGSGDPYTAFARIAAMVALMAGLGFAVAGGSAAAAPMTAAEAKEKTDKANPVGTGTVLGDVQAQSNSILDALELIASNSTIDLGYTDAMRRSLEIISDGMTKSAKAVGLNALPIASALQSLGVTRSSNMPGGSNAKLGADAALPGMFVGSFMSGLFGSTKVKRELQDYGVQFVSQTMADIIKAGMVAVVKYTDVLVTKTTSSMFGLMKSTSQKTETTYEYISDKVSKNIATVLIDLAGSIETAAKQVGIKGEDFTKNLGKINVDFGRISTMATGGATQKQLTAAFSKIADQMARKLQPQFLDFQQMGEGYYKTFVRVSAGIVNATGKLRQFNIQAIDYSKVVQKQSDVEAEIIRQSIQLAADQGKASKDVAEIIKMLSGTGDELLNAYKALEEAKDTLAKVGQGYVEITRDMTNMAGGIDALVTSLNNYYENYFTETEKLAADTTSLEKKFAALGLTMPSVSATVDAASISVTDAETKFAALTTTLDKDTSPAGKKLTEQVTALKDEFVLAATKTASASTEAALLKEKFAALGLVMPGLATDVDTSTGSVKTAKEKFAELADTLSKNTTPAGQQLYKDVVALEDSFLKAATSSTTAKDETKLLKEKFDALGVAMPDVTKSIDTASLSVIDAKNNFKTLAETLSKDTSPAGKDLYVKVLALGEAFANVAETNAKVTEEKLQAIIDTWDAALSEVKKQVDTATTQLIDIYKELGKQNPKDKEEALRLEREKAMKGMDDLTLKYTKSVNALIDASNALTDAQSGMETAYKNLQGIKDKFVGFSQSLTTFRNTLTGTNVDLSPENKYQQSLAAFTDVAAKAAQANETALSNLPDVAKTFLDASREYFASGQGYQNDFQMVLDAVDKAIGATDYQIKLMEGQLELARDSYERLGDLDSTMLDAGQSIDNLKVAMDNYAAAQAKYSSADAIARSVADALKTYLASNPVQAVEQAKTTAVTGAVDTLATQAADAAAKAAADLAAAQAKKAADEAEAARKAGIDIQNRNALAKLNQQVADAQKTFTANQKYYASILTGNPVAAAVFLNKQLNPSAAALKQAKDAVAAFKPIPYMTGTDFVPQDMLASVHRGEKIIDPTSSAILDRYGIQVKTDADGRSFQELKAQTHELQALVRLQSAANQEMIKELKGMKAELAEVSRKAKIEAAA